MSTRLERTENCYRQAMRSALINLLEVINPADQIHFGAMKYEELVIYALDWLQTECLEVTSLRTGAESKTEPTSLSLE